MGVQGNTSLVFSMHLLQGKNTILVHGKDFNFMTDISVSAEVKIDERTIMNFFFTPIKKGFARVWERGNNEKKIYNYS